ncbi:MAG: PadR family transcriptional regulator [Streptosporangiales bacterium]|nr:PadR family transcriptional regulator [Streptosporangiales bacterium]
MTGQAPRRSPLALVLLALLAEEPMHPYRMQQLIKQRDKAKNANVAQRNSVYQAIERLLRSGLIEVHETVRGERRPERTEYAITREGLSTLHEWVITLLGTVAPEYPTFPAALATLPLVTPEEAADALERRAAALEERLAEPLPPDLPRLFLVEDEYQRTVDRAELDWLRSLVADLRSGALTWNQDWLRGFTAGSGPEG